MSWVKDLLLLPWLVVGFLSLLQCSTKAGDPALLSGDDSPSVFTSPSPSPSPESDQDELSDASDDEDTVFTSPSPSSESDQDELSDASDDEDLDGVLDLIDNCLNITNADQRDADGDGQGDACDDDDGDGALDVHDNCLGLANPDQIDQDRDGWGDACDNDDDNDGLADNADNCPYVINFDQADSDGDGVGDLCDDDDDNDGIADGADNCPLIVNREQQDSDGDTLGNACDLDDDNDGLLDAKDNCLTVANPDQVDTDNDNQGDACDDEDADGVIDISDNCLGHYNPDQADTDKDGIGNACNDIKLNERSLQRIMRTPLRYPFRIVLIGDSRGGMAVFGELFAKIAELQPTPVFAIHNGDFTSSGSVNQYLDYVEAVKNWPVPIISVIGNHEQIEANGLSSYIELIGPTDFSFDYGQSRFIALNNCVDGFSDINEEQFGWLEQNVQTGQVSDLFVTMHMPPKYPFDGGYASYAGHFFDAITQFSGAPRLMRLFDDWQVTLGVFGHNHIYANYTTQHTRYLVTGGGGAEINPISSVPWHDGVFYHAILLDIHSNASHDYSGRLITTRADGVPVAEYHFDQSTGVALEKSMPLPFRADFSSSDLSIWENRVYYGPGNRDISDWQVVNERLCQQGNFYANSGDPSYEGASMITWERSWEDVSFSLDLGSSDDDGMGILFRYRDDANYYRFTLDKSRQFHRLVRKKNGVFTSLWQVSKAYTPGRTYHVAGQLRGANINLSIDGQNIVSLSDNDPLLSGGIGLYTWGNAGTCFDNIMVEAMPAD